MIGNNTKKLKQISKFFKDIMKECNNTKKLKLFANYCILEYKR